MLHTNLERDVEGPFGQWKIHLRDQAFFDDARRCHFPGVRMR